MVAEVSCACLGSLRNRCQDGLKTLRLYYRKQGWEKIEAGRVQGDFLGCNASLRLRGRGGWKCPRLLGVLRKDHASSPRRPSEQGHRRLLGPVLATRGALKLRTDVVRWPRRWLAEHSCGSMAMDLRAVSEASVRWAPRPWRSGRGIHMTTLWNT